MVQWIKDLFSGKITRIRDICDACLYLVTRYESYIDFTNTDNTGIETDLDNINVRVILNHKSYFIASEVYVDGELVFLGGAKHPFYTYHADVFEEGPWVDKLINLM